MIKFEHVAKTYEETGQTALDDISFEIKSGSFTYVTGESGSGKSTLIKMILGEEKADHGSVEIDGVDVGKLDSKKMSDYRRSLGVIFQDYRLMQEETVYENIALPLKIRGVSKNHISKQVSYTLSLIGMTNKYNRLPKEISGGEQQKVCLARAIVDNPRILLCDEPTANLDPKFSNEVVKLLEIINQRGVTVVMATHDQELINPMHDKIILKQGRMSK